MSSNTNANVNTNINSNTVSSVPFGFSKQTEL